MVRHDGGVAERRKVFERGFCGRGSPWLTLRAELWPVVLVVADVYGGVVGGGILHVSIGGCGCAGCLIEGNALLQNSDIAGLTLRLCWQVACWCWGAALLAGWAVVLPFGLATCLAAGLSYTKTL